MISDMIQKVKDANVENRTWSAREIYHKVFLHVDRGKYEEDLAGALVSCAYAGFRVNRSVVIYCDGQEFYPVGEYSQRLCVAIVKFLGCEEDVFFLSGKKFFSDFDSLNQHRIENLPFNVEVVYDPEIAKMLADFSDMVEGR